MLLVKNIILYEPAGAVAGFVEIRPDFNRTSLRLKQSTPHKNLFLSVIAGSATDVFTINADTAEFVINKHINLDKEIFVCLIKRSGEKVITVASGSINLDKSPPKKPDAAAEIDAAIRKICSVDDNGNGECSNCPYREYFFSK